MVRHPSDGGDIGGEHHSLDGGADPGGVVDAAALSTRVGVATTVPQQLLPALLTDLIDLQDATARNSPGSFPSIGGPGIRGKSNGYTPDLR